jgi:hypothetical protein
MLVPCPYCPCWFATQADLDAHLKAYTRDPYMHKLKFAAQCLEGGKPKIPCLGCSKLNTCRLNPVRCSIETRETFKTFQTRLQVKVKAGEP